jgi:hypothetical protein
VGGGNMAAHKAALKELLTFLGLPAEVRATQYGCVYAQCNDESGGLHFSNHAYIHLAPSFF